MLLLTVVDGAIATYPLMVNAWLQQQKLTANDAAANDYFGYGVALDGDTAVIGAPQDDDQGAVTIFVHDGTGWGQQAKLTADDAAAGDYFGWTVALAGDTAVIGAPRYYTDVNGSGAAYVFARNGSGWSQQAKLTADDAAAGDNFGWTVALDGDTAVIGASQYDNDGNENGSAYVFVRSDTSWSQQAKLTAGDAAAGDNFGWTVALNGETAVIGAPQDDDDGNGSGSAYVFTRNGTSWNQQAKLTANDAAAGDAFGFAVALDNDTVVVGAWEDDSEVGVNSGSAYVFVRSGTSWSQQARLIADDAAQFSAFGWAAALENDTAAIGAVYPSNSAYIFVRNGASWSQQAKLTPSDPTAENDFGNDVALFGNTAVVGAPGDDDSGNASGSAYTFTFTPPVKLSIDDVSLAEGDAGKTDFSFTVTRTDNSEAISVDFATAENTATITDSDYVPISGTVNFAAGGNLSQHIIIQVDGDTRVESDETFFVNLTNASEVAVIADSHGVGTIQNDDDNYDIFLPMVVKQLSP
jgi:hypothetical protein